MQRVRIDSERLTRVLLIFGECLGLFVSTDGEEIAEIRANRFGMDDGRALVNHERRRARGRVLTVNRQQRRIAESLGGHVLGHARIIGRVLQPGLADQQVALAGHDHVVVRFDLHVVPEPVHPGRRNAVRRQTP